VASRRSRWVTTSLWWPRCARTLPEWGAFMHDAAHVIVNTHARLVDSFAAGSFFVRNTRGMATLGSVSHTHACMLALDVFK